MEQRKSFFRERTPSEIKRMKPKLVYHPRGLVERIDGLNYDEAIQIQAQIVPGKFFRNVDNGADASRKAYKHGDLIAQSHPRTLGECFECSEIPLQMRARDFAKLKGMREEEINFVGYSFQPQWAGKLKRIVPFVWLPEGVRLFGYAENCAFGIDGEGFKVEPYKDVNKVKREGANIIVEVPSRTKKDPRYKVKLLHVPVIRNQNNLASVLTLKPSIPVDEETGEPESRRVMHDVYNIRYTWEEQREGSEVITFYPQDVAAYIGIIKHFNAKHNLTPIDMNPFALPSRHQAEFYMKLCNNVLVYDPSLASKDKLRKPHVAEKSILLARAIGRFGNDDFAFWDPERDGKLKDYDWSVPGEK